MPLQGLPTDGPKFFEIQKMEGLNTKAKRPGIEDQQFAWCENFMPIGANNLRATYGKGTNLFSATGGRTIVWEYPYNLAATPFIFVALSDGSGIQVHAVSGAQTTIAGAGTFYNGGSLPAAAQWGNQYLLIVANAGSTSGYFIWDGTTLYQAGSLGPFVTGDLISGGATYTSAPDVIISGGGGAGATATAVVTNGAVTSLTLTNAGTGFTSEPTVRIGSVTPGGTTGGSVVSVIILNGGTGYTSAPTFTFAPASTTAGTATVLGGQVTAFTLSNNGAGYTGQPAITIGGPGTGAVAIAVVANVAAARLPIMPSGIVGNAIETFQGRVWPVNGTTVYFSAPNSVNNFATSSGGGSFVSTESNLRVQYNNIVASNGFLYLFADSSVAVVSNVQTSGNPPTTTFNVAGIDPQIGTPWRDSVEVFGRAIVFATTSGIYAAYGGSVDKISDNLDGVFMGASLPTSGAATSFLSAAVATIYEIKCYILSLQITDPFTGGGRRVLLCWDGRKWFVASHEVTISFIASQEFNGNLVAWGTDGTNLFKLFQTASETITKTVQSKLWAGDGMVIFKRVMRVYTDIVENGASALGITVSLDTDVATSQQTLTATSFIVFVNTLGGALQFQNNTFGNLVWTVPGLGVNGIDASVVGKLLGFTITTNNADVTLIDALMLYENLAPYA